MESFKIRDFNTAFKIGIENLVKESIINASSHKKMKSKLPLSRVITILKQDIFVINWKFHIYCRKSLVLKVKILMMKN